MPGTSFVECVYGHVFSQSLKPGILVDVLQIDPFHSVRLLSISLTGLVERPSQAIDATQGMMCFSSIPNVQLDLLFPKRPPFSSKTIRALRQNYHGHGLDRESCFVPDQSCVLDTLLANALAYLNLEVIDRIVVLEVFPEPDTVLSRVCVVCNLCLLF